MLMKSVQNYTKPTRIINLLNSKRHDYRVERAYSNYDDSTSDLRGWVIELYLFENGFRSRRFVVNPPDFTEDQLVTLVQNSPLIINLVENPPENLKKLHNLIHIL